MRRCVLRSITLHWFNCKICIWFHNHNSMQDVLMYGFIYTIAIQSVTGLGWWLFFYCGNFFRIVAVDMWTICDIILECFKVLIQIGLEVFGCLWSESTWNQTLDYGSDIVMDSTELLRSNDNNVYHCLVFLSCSFVQLHLVCL